MTQKLLVSDADYNEKHIEYIKSALGDSLSRLGGELADRAGGGRSELTITADETALKLLRPALEDRISDVIAVGYKYSYFKRFVRTAGLNELEYELLLAALISADLDDDKRYVRCKIRNLKNYTVDGAFNFTMKPLKDKWSEVVAFIPSVFGKKELGDFVAYLVKEKRGRRVYVDRGSVYDKHFSRLTRVKLTERGNAETLREIIISAAGEVELESKISEEEEIYLKQFYGDGIFFGKSYFG